MFLTAIRRCRFCCVTLWVEIRRLTSSPACIRESKLLESPFQLLGSPRFKDHPTYLQLLLFPFYSVLFCIFFRFVILCILFLGAPKHLYDRLFPSDGQLVCWSGNAFVRRSTRRTLLACLALFPFPFLFANDSI